MHRRHLKTNPELQFSAGDTSISHTIHFHPLGDEGIIAETERFAKVLPGFFTALIAGGLL